MSPSPAAAWLPAQRLGVRFLATGTYLPGLQVQYLARETINPCISLSGLFFSPSLPPSHFPLQINGRKYPSVRIKKIK